MHFLLTGTILGIEHGCSSLSDQAGKPKQCKYMLSFKMQFYGGNCEQASHSPRFLGWAETIWVEESVLEEDSPSKALHFYQI